MCARVTLSSVGGEERRATIDDPEGPSTADPYAHPGQPETTDSEEDERDAQVDDDGWLVP